ncbi:MAG: hypothetical protein J5930_03120 [Treponema sp.]|nr:hypothetical protein [Treponema sp.]
MTSGLFVSLLSMVVGIIVAVFTDFSVKVIVVLLGFAGLVKGFSDLVKVRVLLEDSTFRRMVIARSLVSIAVGVLAVCLPVAFFNTAEKVVHILLFVLAVCLVISSAVGFFLVTKLDEGGVPSKSYRLESVAMLLIAMLLLVIAIVGVKGIVRIMGIVLAVCSAIVAVYEWRNKPIVVEPESVSDVSSEAQAHEEKNPPEDSSTEN